MSSTPRISLPRALIGAFVVIAAVFALKLWRKRSGPEACAKALRQSVATHRRVAESAALLIEVAKHAELSPAAQTTARELTLARYAFRQIEEKTEEGGRLDPVRDAEAIARYREALPRIPALGEELLADPRNFATRPDANRHTLPFEELKKVWDKEAAALKTAQDVDLDACAP